MATKPLPPPTLAAKMAGRLYLLLTHPLLNGAMEPELDGAIHGRRAVHYSKRHQFLYNLRHAVRGTDTPEVTWGVIRVLNYSGDRLVWRNIDGRSRWQNGGVTISLKFRRIKESWPENDHFS